MRYTIQDAGGMHLAQRFATILAQPVLTPLCAMGEHRVHGIHAVCHNIADFDGQICPVASIGRPSSTHQILERSAQAKSPLLLNKLFQGDNSFAGTFAELSIVDGAVRSTKPYGALGCAAHPKAQQEYQCTASALVAALMHLHAYRTSVGAQRRALWCLRALIESRELSEDDVPTTVQRTQDLHPRRPSPPRDGPYAAATVAAPGGAGSAGLTRGP